MKNTFVFLLLTMPIILQAQVEKTLKKTIELQMPKTAEDSFCGTRGAAVVWHEVQKKYYAAFAGNSKFPFAVFNAAGKRLSGDNITCMEDVRGLWYNPKLKKIFGNGYNAIGWFGYQLDAKGIPVENEIILAGINQPSVNSIGTYNAKSGNIYFLEGQFIHTYNENAFEEEDSVMRIYPGISKAADIDKTDDGFDMIENYNSNILLYTGISKAEFGILNTATNQVELYNRKTGLLTMKLKLPVGITTWASFNFSFANGIYWAYNQEKRTWEGLK